MQRQLTSDNQSGICPEAWAAMAEANQSGHVPSYGDDEWTARAADLFREQFESDRCEVFFCLTGTAANSLAIAQLCQSYHSVICHETAHIETDECGAPEFFANGAKLLTARGESGKLRPNSVRELIRKRADIHYPQPQLLSLTQATELGTVYTPDELDELSHAAKSADLHLHMDGARFANAVVSLGLSPKELTWQVGVDVLCLGGTKNGMAVGEAVIFFDPELANEFDYRCKQAGQLASKMRFLAAPWERMLRDGAWLRNARHANEMAQYLARSLQAFPDVKILYPVQANSVFIKLSTDQIKALHKKGWSFYTFIAGNARLMTSWDTDKSDIDRFCGDLAESSLCGHPLATADTWCI